MIRRRSSGRNARHSRIATVVYQEPFPFEGAALLSRKTHSKLGWSRPKTFGYLDRCTALPFILPEALSAAAFLPLALSSDAVPRPMIVLSRASGLGSPFVQDGRLFGRHYPSILRFYPFLPTRDLQTGKLALAADLGGPFLLEHASDIATTPVFSPDAGLGEATTQHVAGIAEWASQRDKALAAAQALKSAGILCPVSEECELWQTVDPVALHALTASQSGKLHVSGALTLAHALITGAMHLPYLSEAIPDDFSPDGKDVMSFLTALAGSTSDATIYLPEPSSNDRNST
ncbi:MAG: hypothetical protein EA339_15485 [Rhodobacteraceae bacterium]|nr:MAG: hypothetical protein EA339_15485 [Paracoccaceae bacterium]